MILATRHTGIVVRNLERSLGFYCGILGLEIWRRAVEEGRFIEKVVGIPGVRLEWVKLKAPNGSLVELLQYHTHPVEAPIENASSNRLGCSHVAFTVEDLDAVYRRLVASRCHCNSEPQRSPDGRVKIIYCHDYDGVLLELVEELQQ